MQNPAFTVEDFCKDPQFIGWVLTPTDESNRVWQTYMADYPHKVADIQLAIDYVKTIQFRELEPSPQDLARLKQRIWQDIEPAFQAPERRWYGIPTDAAGHRSDGDNSVRDHPVRVVQWYHSPYWAAAAVVLLVASMGMGWWTWRANSSLTYETAYGKIQEIHLADGSVVTLNAHSSLRVGNDLLNSPVREVWLDGEAYFDIATRKGAKFIVHTPEAQVEVLGTEFNVNTRREQTNVVLHEGKVQLSANDVSAVVMKPGDMATVTPKSRQIQLKSVKPDLYDAWKESYIVLDGKTLTEIVNSLQDTFGVTINVEDAQLADKKLTGKLRTDVAEDCIDNLAIIMEADVKKVGDTYVLK
ncbi:FecR family protein [Spirosoma areae]